LKNVFWEDEPLVVEKIRSEIHSEAASRLMKLEIFDCIDSTNTYLLQQAKSRAVSGWVCLAEEQMQGRGRLGRVWFSPRGANIYCSLLCDFAQHDVSALSIAVGVIVVKALQKYGVRQALQLKWPNDIVFSRRKLGGILLERSGSFVVIGIGLNLYLPDDMDVELAANSIDLSTIMANTVSRNQLAGLLINELLIQLPLFMQHGIKHFLSDWCQFDALKGKDIVVKTPQQIFSGVMQGINEQGELLLCDAQGHQQSFCYGEASVRVDM
jgi:BirA family transcriptional regulator, biotin operon repressor / biotin---[acetyl-CoA-carboxylase] ligase